MSDQVLSDAVWSRLDPRAARLDPRSRLMLIVLIVAAGLLTVLLVVTAKTGLLTPQLSGDSIGGSAKIGSRQVTTTLAVRNDGWADETVDAVDVTSPGMTLVRASGIGTIAAGQTRRVTAVIHLADCAMVTRSTTIPVRLRLDRFWGTKTLTLDSDASDLPWHACGRR